MESIKSIEIVTVVEEDNLSFNVDEDDVVEIMYEATSIGVRLLVTDKEKTQTEVIIPWSNVSSSSVIK